MFSKAQRAAADAELDRKLASLLLYKQLTGDVGGDPKVPGPVHRSVTVGRVRKGQGPSSFEDFDELVGKRTKFATPALKRDPKIADQDPYTGAPTSAYHRAKEEVITAGLNASAYTERTADMDSDFIDLVRQDTAGYNHPASDIGFSKNRKWNPSENKWEFGPPPESDAALGAYLGPRQKAEGQLTTSMDPIQGQKRAKYASKLLQKRDDLEALMKRRSDPDAYEPGMVVLDDPGESSLLRLMESPVPKRQALLMKIKNDAIWNNKNNLDRVAAKVLSDPGLEGGVAKLLASTKALGSTLRRIR